MKQNHDQHLSNHKRPLILVTAILTVALIVIMIILVRPEPVIAPSSTPSLATPTSSTASSTSTLSPRTSTGSLPAQLSPQMTYKVINAYPHDATAFTQGLIYLNGYIYESTGLYGESSLRKVDLETGEILKQVDLSPAYFAEGLTVWEDRLLQLTWRENVGFIYNLDDFTLEGQFSFPTQGWGLTHDGERLILSDGTPTIYFLNPDTFQIMDSVDVIYQGEGVERLNELEYIRGEVFANIWQTDNIIRIDPASGEVLGWIDLDGILPQEQRTPETDVLNGIAYDPQGNRLFLTGKRWPLLFEIRLVPIRGDEN